MTTFKFLLTMLSLSILISCDVTNGQQSQKDFGVRLRSFSEQTLRTIAQDSNFYNYKQAVLQSMAYIAEGKYDESYANALVGYLQQNPSADICNIPNAASSLPYWVEYKAIECLNFKSARTLGETYTGIWELDEETRKKLDLIFDQYYPSFRTRIGEIRDSAID